MGSFAVARWGNPVKAEWFKRNYEKMLAAQEENDAKYEELPDQLAEEDPECRLGRQALIACAFDAYKSPTQSLRNCRKISQ